ncbi:substrate-binding domain-containing protein [Amycolatopsis anabasis]|uniref:substrate-binding domain-containing protein n=1 Tax=Amycolatopsis anabasis TaxID=1840409 RepID=UPI001FE4FD11|nr:substrate-binding domain-containing protein [Amycolatopsis anabasis]
MAAGACLMLTGTASAVQGPNSKQEVLAAAGSDTTQDISAAILANANGASWNTDPDNYVNIAPVLTDPFTVPGDQFCAAKTYGPGGIAVPNGSTAGKDALKASANNGDGCIDIARSSSRRGANDPATFEYYGFARDGVSWSAKATGAGAGVTLSLGQLRDIYRGTITNWSQVGGANAPIELYLPQTGSGTLSFFTGTVLGFDPATIPGLTVNRFQEHDATSIDPAKEANAIAPFSTAQWIAQGNGVVADKRDGFVVGTLTGAGSDGAPVSGTAGNYVPAFADGFLGARVVFHVVDTRTPSYGQAVNAIGFDADGPSPLCAGDLAGTLSQFGFKPLPADDDGITCTKS